MSKSKKEKEDLDLPRDPRVPEGDAPEAETHEGFTIKDPEALKPKELPLVIEPEGGSWQNDAQAEYARVLNGYAYRNPKKFAAKKNALAKELADLGKLGAEDAQARLRVLTGKQAIGSNARLEISDKRIQK